MATHIYRINVPILGKLRHHLIPAPRMKPGRMNQQNLLTTGLAPFEYAQVNA
jgi:hypothetical protein